MEWMRQWCTGICYGAVGCCAIQLLVPDKGTGKVFRLVAMTFFLCCLVLPLWKIGAEISLPIDFLPQAVVEEQLNERVEQQLRQQVEQAVTQLTEEALAYRGVQAKKITVSTDTSENGSIYIKQVVLWVDKQTVPIAEAVGETLGNQWNTTVIVERGG